MVGGYAKFRINFEDVSRVPTTIWMRSSSLRSRPADGKLIVRLTPEYEAGGIRHNMGYIISGTNKDGVYLVVQDENVEAPYYLNVPAGMSRGGSTVASPPAACKKLPYVGGTDSLAYSERTFATGASTATLLKDPLWYASKWGGFVDHNDDGKPDLTSEWDSDDNGAPDTYFLVQNPLKLREALQGFDTVDERSASSRQHHLERSGDQDGTTVFQCQFNSATWDGELFAVHHLVLGCEYRLLLESLRAHSHRVA